MNPVLDYSGPPAELIIPPQPLTERGYPKVLCCSIMRNRIAYTNQKTVIIRSLGIIFPYHLNSQILSEDRKDVILFHCHKYPVNVGRFNPAGTFIATGDSRGNLYIWEIKNKKVKLETFVGSSINDIAWSPDGQRVVAVGNGSEEFAKVFMADSGNKLGEMRGHCKQIMSVDYKPSRPFMIATGGEDLSVYLYAGPPFKSMRYHKEYAGYPSCVRYSPDGNTLVVAAEKSIFIYDGKTGDKIKDIINGHKGSIYAVAFRPDGSSIATVSADKSCKIWNTSTWELSSTYTLGTEIDQMQVGVAWSNTDLITLSLNGVINFLEQKSNSVEKTWIGHKDKIAGIEVDKAARIIYSADVEGNIARWNMDTGEGTFFSNPLNKHTKHIVAISLSTGTDYLHSVGLEPALRLNDCKEGAYGIAVGFDGGSPTCVTSGKNYCALGTFGGKVNLYSGSRKLATVDIGCKIKSLAFSVNDTLLAIGQDNGVISIYNLANDTLTYRTKIVKHTAFVSALSFSPDGKFLVSGCNNRYIYFWEVDKLTGDTVTDPLNSRGHRFHDSAINSLRFSPSSSILVSSSLDQNIIIWKDLKTFDTNEKIKLALCHIGGVYDAIPVDDNTIVSCGDDRSIKIFKV